MPLSFSLDRHIRELSPEMISNDDAGRRLAITWRLALV